MGGRRSCSGDTGRDKFLSLHGFGEHWLPWTNCTLRLGADLLPCSFCFCISGCSMWCPSLWTAILGLSLHAQDPGTLEEAGLKPSYLCCKIFLCILIFMLVERQKQRERKLLSAWFIPKMPSAAGAEPGETGNLISEWQGSKDLNYGPLWRCWVCVTSLRRKVRVMAAPDHACARCWCVQ